MFLKSLITHKKNYWQKFKLCLQPKWKYTYLKNKEKYSNNHITFIYKLEGTELNTVIFDHLK